MGHGTSKGTVDASFSARIAALEEQARKMAEQFRAGDDYRPWHVPSEMQSQSTLDVTALHNPAWDRNALNALYSEGLFAGPGKQSGTSGDLIATKYQIDFMAAEERAFRMRHASLPRCAALMHGRLRGHGTEQVSVFSFLQQTVENYIAAGRAHGGTG